MSHQVNVLRVGLIFNIMLYLFGSGSYRNDRKIVKVGFTDDVRIREAQYKLHNPLGEMIATRQGDEILELKLHLRLQDYKVEFLDEWFYDEPEVQEAFGSTIGTIDQWLWNNRSDIFYPLPKIGSKKRTIYEELRSLFDNPINPDITTKVL